MPSVKHFLCRSSRYSSASLTSFRSNLAYSSTNSRLRSIAFTAVKKIESFLIIKVPFDSEGNGGAETAAKVDGNVLISAQRITVILEPISVHRPAVLSFVICLFQFAAAPYSGVTGSMGSGKSALSATILGDMTRVSGDLSVSGQLGFTSQSVWLEPTSVRENVLFGCPMREDLVR